METAAERGVLEQQRFGKQDTQRLLSLWGTAWPWGLVCACVCYCRSKVSMELHRTGLWQMSSQIAQGRKHCLWLLKVSIRAVRSPEDSPDTAIRMEGHRGAIALARVSGQTKQGCRLEGMALYPAQQALLHWAALCCCSCRCHLANTKWKPEAVPAPQKRFGTGTIAIALNFSTWFCPRIQSLPALPFSDRRYLSE